jgi:hypothetical protein
VVTTTPRPAKLIRDLVRDPICVVTRGSSYENRGNLAPAFFEQIIRKIRRHPARPAGARRRATRKHARRAVVARFDRGEPAALSTGDDARHEALRVRLAGYPRQLSRLDLQHSRELGDDLQSRIARAHPSPPERLRFMTDVSPLGQSNEILLISRIELEVAVAVDGLDLDLALLGFASHSQLDCDTSLATTP